MMLFLDKPADSPAQGGNRHTVDGGESPVDEVGHHGAADYARYGAPVHLLLRDILPAVCEVVEDEDDTHRRQGAVKDVEPAAEVRRCWKGQGLQCTGRCH